MRKSITSPCRLWLAVRPSDPSRVRGNFFTGFQQANATARLWHLLGVPSDEPKEFRHGITGGVSSCVTINCAAVGK